MKRTKRTQIAWIVGIIAILAIVGLGLTACGDGGGGGGGCNADCLAIGETGEGGGKIIYHKHSGFTVTGLGTCYYLEAAPTNQATDVTWSSTHIDVTGATGTAIGTGKANTAAIIAAHPEDTVTNNAAKAAAACTDGGKNDWFLPSKDELNEMYKARTHLDLVLDIGFLAHFFWSSSQHHNSINFAWGHRFDEGYTTPSNKDDTLNIDGLRSVRAVRAF